MTSFFKHSCLVFAAILFCTLTPLLAQRSVNGSLANQPHQCGSSFMLGKTDPVKQATFEQMILNKLAVRAMSAQPDTQQYTIPIVFHVIHQNGPENISDTDLRDAHQLLNAAFKNTVPFDPASGVDIDISFCLGSNAITRHSSPLTDITMETDDYNLKSIGGWDPNTYINIWVVNSITSLNMGPAVAGYAMFPSAHGSAIDGIVVEAAFLNNNPDNVKVLIHEVGHYLGLYHTFEGGCTNNDCTVDGDRVCDTPPDNSIAGVSCTGSVNTCHSDSDDPSPNNPFRAVALGGLGDQNDMIKNYMDYGFQSCQTMFTDGQRTRMRNSLVNARASLLTNPNACQQCTNPITASMNLPTSISAGTSVTFSVNVANPASMLIIWQFNNQTQVGQSINVNFPSGGTFPIKVYIIDQTATSCYVNLFDTVVVNCPVTTPVFTVTPAGMVSPGETIILSAPNNGYTYTWMVDGIIIGTGNTFNYTVNGTNGRLLTVAASNGTCQATSEPYYIDPNNCSSSKENNTWYFGMSGGVNFNTSPPTAIQGKLSVEEGCAVICDANGNAMFHSDGSSVGNSQTGLALQNGTGLSGNTTTTQGALFVPMPGSTRYIYLFTVDYQAGDFNTFGGGIHYSIIDKQGNGGQGSVTTKNQLLTALVTEKLTAVKNLSGNGVWIIAHKWNSNAFYAWQITASGVSSPMISYAGSIHQNLFSPFSGGYAAGEMKVSPSGTKLAVAIQGNGRTELFDFNRQTGAVSNPVNLQHNLINSNYGLAFSPNERFLYVSGISGAKIVRYDLSAGSPTAIIASCTLIGSENGSGGAIQLAPDGRIYASRRGSFYLGVISNPNAVNAANCGYVGNGLKLFGYSSSFYGLPNPVQSSLLSVKPSINGPDKICLDGNPHTAGYFINKTGRASYNWTHKGVNSFSALSDSTATMTYNVPGNDTLIIKRSAPCGDSYDTLVIRSGAPQPFDIGPDRLVCRGTSVTLDAGPGHFTYRWSNNTYQQTASINAQGKVNVEVTTSTGCLLKDSLMVNYYSLPSLQLGRDTSICTGETISLSAPPGMDSYLWNTGPTSQSITSQDSGRYIVTVGKYGCLFRDTILVRKDAPHNLLSKDTVVLCLGGTSIYKAPTGFDTYHWQLPDGSTANTTTVTISDPGYYVLSYTNRCGTGKDSVYHYIPKLFNHDTLVSCADTIRLISNLHLDAFSAVYYYSYIQHADTIDVYRSGTYHAASYYPNLQSGCLLAQSITVLVDTSLTKPPMTVNLGPDVSYCPGNVLPLNAGSGFDWYRWNTGSVDSATTVYGFGDYWVKAHYCGYDYVDTIHVSRDNSLTVSLGNDQFICPGGTISLNAGAGYDWYNWSNGQQTQQITASSNGQYMIEVGLNGCTARDTVMISDAETTFTVSGSSLICPGEIITLTASGSAGTQYIWDSLGVQASTNGHSLPVSAPGSYSVKNLLCPASAGSTPFVVSAEILAAIQASFNPSPVCPQDSVSISFNAGAFSSYQWSDGVVRNPRKFIGSSIPVLTVSGIRCSESHSLAIPLSTSPSCDPGTVGLQNAADCESGYLLVPNPGKDVVTLSPLCEVKPPLNVIITGAEGKCVGSISGDPEQVNNYLNQLMPQLSPAVYALSVEDHRGQYHFKWVILK